MKAFITALDEQAEVMRAARGALAEPVQRAFDVLGAVVGRRGRILVCGNGGSAADAQHFVAELVGRFERERSPCAAIALTVDSSVVTAVANDYGYASVFERQVLALGRPGDALIAISTSGNSVNVVRAAVAAQDNAMAVVAMTGLGGGLLGAHCDVLVEAPSKRVARAQEVHELVLHALAEALEEAIADEEAAR